MRDNLHRVSVRNVTLIEFMRSQPDASLDRFVFLDSQDWMRPEQIAEMWTEIARVGKPGTRIVFRTAATSSPVETALPPSLKAKFDYKEALSKALLQEDRSAIYGGFHLYVMEELDSLTERLLPGKRTLIFVCDNSRHCSSGRGRWILGRGARLARMRDAGREHGRASNQSSRSRGTVVGGE